ncbi:hypothetical protein J2Y45_004774 [Dyadobacter sp. BE34]|uniref:Uncharacterized protein n=1 Tax=Dyadobacter fermentans TaxID=94254 RepID=A0ABU1R2C3_9BACT|nr:MULTISPECIES: hypothetical protein [Dyadobacter]MDR6807574.1 hypothetical protein [Dyadobacter fermentans]MDR7045315.1 hypothetical protein [Dyadobacter sp. BE242]MDR7199628.1 hypothetical protein [Dyadobacter sp. BE34]MDR7217913.1 hypothetical protein [Dyadobacter sp. BE31]MDR7265519.1 hypothetical protein [Dyadobacter sp. BE32]
MNQEKYDLSIEEDCHMFRFISEGPQGRIEKVIAFKPISGVEGCFYNLSFGDWDELTQSLDDSVVTNNLDTIKVLATIAQAVDSFFLVKPEAVIFASGSSSARNRLYQMNIQKYLPEIKKRFFIRGRRNKKWQPFKKGVNYDAFTLFRK